MTKIINNKQKIIPEKELKETRLNIRKAAVRRAAAFYRENPHRLAKDYLNIQSLRTFQEIDLYAMMHHNHFMFIAARSLGKTWLTALFCVIRAILYPGTKIVIASGTRKQANEVLEKIRDDFCMNYDWGSSNLNAEIKEVKISANEGLISFHNGSWIKTVTSSDNARGERANLLILDEFRMIPKDILDAVLRKFMGNSRSPGFLTKEPYRNNTKYLESNVEIYMSSAWKKSHWSYLKAQTFFSNMLSGKSYFFCALPYQLSILEGLRKIEDVIDEMSEEDFNEMIWSMEMECMWLGNNKGAFFNYDDIDSRRVLKDTLLDFKKDKNKRPARPDGVRRILSCDVALMASTKDKNNDASSLIINDATPSKNNTFMANVVYLKSYEGLTTDELGLKIMKAYYDFNCTDIVLDTNGNGLGVYDFIIKDQFDKDTGKVYPALNCCNDTEMAKRCKVKDADKVIWSIKATARFNSDAATYLRNGFKSGKINLPINEVEADRKFIEQGAYKSNEYDKRHLMREQYIQTSLLVNELIHLQHEIKDGNKVKIDETSSARKDRYSSLSYNYYVMLEIEQKSKPRKAKDKKKKTMKFRKPIYK